MINRYKVELLIITISLLFASCEVPKRKTGKEALTEIQIKYIKSSSLEFQAFMDTCLSEVGYLGSYNYCYREFKKTSIPDTESGNSILETATGTALGYGAARTILGK